MLRASPHIPTYRESASKEKKISKESPRSRESICVIDFVESATPADDSYPRELDRGVSLGSLFPQRTPHRAPRPALPRTRTSLPSR